MSFLTDLCTSIQGLEPGTYFFEPDDLADLPQEPLSTCPGSVLAYVATFPSSTPPPESVALFYRFRVQIYEYNGDLYYQVSTEVRSQNDTEWTGVDQPGTLCITTQPCLPEPTDDCLCCDCGCGCSE